MKMKNDGTEFVMKNMTVPRVIRLTEEEREELERDWDIWGDESYALHAAYILRRAIERQQDD